MKPYQIKALAKDLFQQILVENFGPYITDDELTVIAERTIRAAILFNEVCEQELPQREQNEE